MRATRVDAALSDVDRRGALARAREEVLIAEGSDWFWWYGDDHSSEHDLEFDDLFRRHLRNVYRLLDKPCRTSCSSATSRRARRPPRQSRADGAPDRRRIDGEETSYFEWLGAGQPRGPGDGRRDAPDRPAPAAGQRSPVRVRPRAALSSAWTPRAGRRAPGRGLRALAEVPQARRPCASRSRLTAGWLDDRSGTAPVEPYVARGPPASRVLEVGRAAATRRSTWQVAAAGGVLRGGLTTAAGTSSSGIRRTGPSSCDAGCRRRDGSSKRTGTGRS